MNYAGLQRKIGSEMRHVDKQEESISKDLEKTKVGIGKLQKKKNSKGLLGLMLGGIMPLAFTLIGGLILITLARLALNKWSKTYMPKSDKSKLTIFGISIPGWG